MRRRGFTLIELMVVVVIIGILVGILVPAVMNSVRTASNAAVAAEIRALSQELASFNTKYGTFPPSRIVFAEDGDYSDANLGDYKQLGQRSMKYLRKIWPRLQFKTDGKKPVISGGWYDFNGDHKLNDPYVIEGHECLVMFLGGVPSASKNGFETFGFDKNPLNPFTSNDPPPSGKMWPHGSNRSPGFAFSGGRLVATKNPTLVKPDDGPLLAYKDTLGGVYAYFSAYDGSGYDPDDCNLKEEGQWVFGAFQTGNAATPAAGSPRRDIIKSPAPNPYTDDSPIPLDSDEKFDPDNRRSVVYLNKSTYQIISPGRDHLYGIGGAWNMRDGERLPFYMAVNGITGESFGREIRLSEIDNITNFAPGELGR